MSRVRHSLNRQNQLDALDEETCIENTHEPSERLHYNPNNALLPDDQGEWAAVAGQAIDIRIEVQKKFSAHRELWDRLETLILNALENRTLGQNQYGSWTSWCWTNPASPRLQLPAVFFLYRS
jgi:hypothetical protein